MVHLIQRQCGGATLGLSGLDVTGIYRCHPFVTARIGETILTSQNYSLNSELHVYIYIYTVGVYIYIYIIVYPNI